MEIRRPVARDNPSSLGKSAHIAVTPRHPATVVDFAARDAG
jgi:hypothetical protein